jgi:hypothetical protein
MHLRHVPVLACVPLACAIAGLLAGCASMQPVDMNAAMQQYYTQQRTYQPFRVTNLSAVTFSGTNMEFAVTGTLDPLSIWPREPSTQELLIRETGSALRLLGGLYLGGEVMKDALKTHVVQPQVVRPEIIQPQVVRPEIIQLPATP